MGKQVWGEQGLLDQNTVALLSYQLTVACVFEDPGRTHYDKFTEPLSWEKWHRALFCKQLQFSLDLGLIPSLSYYVGKSLPFSWTRRSNLGRIFETS